MSNKYLMGWLGALVAASLAGPQDEKFAYLIVGVVLGVALPARPWLPPGGGVPTRPLPADGCA